MDYVELVERVAQTIARMDHSPRSIVTPDVLAAAMDLDVRQDGLHHAIEDLSRIGMIGPEPHSWIKPTPNLDKIRIHGRTLRDLWPPVFREFLTPEQEQFLKELVSLAQTTSERYANTQMVRIAEVYEQLGWDLEHPDAYWLTQALENAGLVQAWKATGYSIDVRPTYAGVVRATQKEATEWQERLSALLAEGETTTVDVKRRLKLDTVREKAELIRDVLGLATTKASGRERFLVIGFDNDTLEFVESVGQGITRDRLGQILNAYAEPQPEIDWVTVPVAGGTAGLVVVRRDPTKVPYRISKAIWKLDVGNVYVRHGTQTEAPTEAELAALELEGRRARGEV